MSVKSATGYQLERAELLSTDSEGNPIKHRPRGLYEVPVHETRPTPNSTHGLEHQQELSRVLKQLNHEEREVLRLQEQGEWKVLTMTMTPAEVSAIRLDVHTLMIGELHKGKHEVMRRFPVTLTYRDIGERLGLSPRQVQSRVVSANRKLRGAR